MQLNTHTHRKRETHTHTQERQRQNESSVDRHLNRGLAVGKDERMREQRKYADFLEIKHSIISTYKSGAFQKQLNSEVCISNWNGIEIDNHHHIHTVHIRTSKSTCHAYRLFTKFLKSTNVKHPLHIVRFSTIESVLFNCCSIMHSSLWICANCQTPLCAMKAVLPFTVRQ